MYLFNLEQIMHRERYLRINILIPVDYGTAKTVYMEAIAIYQ